MDKMNEHPQSSENQPIDDLTQKEETLSDAQAQPEAESLWTDEELMQILESLQLDDEVRPIPEESKDDTDTQLTFEYPKLDGEAPQTAVEPQADSEPPQNSDAPQADAAQLFFESFQLDGEKAFDTPQADSEIQQVLENLQPEETQPAADAQLSNESNDWLDNLLRTPQSQTDISADEHAVLMAGLTRPEDDELEKILAEDWSNTPEPEAETAVDTPPAVAEEPAPEEEPEKPAQIRKIRPKMKKGYGLFGIPHVIVTAVWLALIVAIGLSLGRMLWIFCADVMAFDKDYHKVTITITDTDDIDTISQKLGQANLVRYPELFKFFATVTGKDEDISSGTFTLHSHLDYNAMINAMVYYGPTREEVDIMFPSGVTCAEIFKMLEENNVCDVAALEAYVATADFSAYWFLEGVPTGNKYCLEGYLAPDTYTFYTHDDPYRVIDKFLSEFDDRFTDRMKEDLVTIQEQYRQWLEDNEFDKAYIEENPLTLHQIVTMASIIQKETASDSECYDFASVYYNRLTNPNFLYLESKATVFYAIGDYFGEISELTEEHLNTDSPYNTLNHKGLPPGPICNMGVHPLYAALEPNDTDYYYYYYDTDTYSHDFSYYSFD